MWRLNISCFLFQIFTLALLPACVPTEVQLQPTESDGDSGVATSTPVARGEVSWLHNPQARIVRVTFCCSPLMSPNEQMAYLPEAQIWGDGRILWVERGTTQRVLVGLLSEEQISNLLRRIAEAGFFNWEDYYSSALPPTDTPARCIEVHLEFQSKQVCELEDGAPPAFVEIHSTLIGGAGANGNDYLPEIGYLSGFQLDESTLRANGYPLPEPDLEWPVELGISIAEAIHGVWIEGNPLAEIWRAAMASDFQLPVVADESGTYRLVVQVPGISLVEPPER